MKEVHEKEARRKDVIREVEINECVVEVMIKIDAY